MSATQSHTLLPSAAAIPSERSSRSPSRERQTEYIRSRSRDAFFRPGTPEGQAADQKANALRQADLAQRSPRSSSRGREEYISARSRDTSRPRHAGEGDESRSRSRTREIIERVSRSVSRDPFFHRGSPELRAEEQRANALSQVRHALDAHAAGVADAERRHSRSDSRSRQAVEETKRDTGLYSVA